MAMSKKDFVALADRMKDFFETNAGSEMGLEARGVLINHLVWFCQDQNPRFMRERWLGYVAGTNGKNGGRK